MLTLTYRQSDHWSPLRALYIQKNYISVYTKMYHDLKTYLGAITKLKFCSDTKHDEI
jgi:hypothetical protein